MISLSRTWQSFVQTLFLSVAALLMPSTMIAQTQQPPEQEAKSAPEMITQETPVFRVRVNQVLMKVVVRDRNGKVVGDLKQEDFEIRDNGKPQKITSFSSESHAGEAESARENANANSTTQPVPAKKLEIPERFIAYFFDDLHFEMGDMLQVKRAAERHLATLPSGDRAAVFTTSGRGQVDFTDDREQLLKAIRGIHRLAEGRVASECPWMTYYFADLILNKDDKRAIELGAQQTMKCMGLDDPGIAERLLMSSAYDALTLGDRNTWLAISALDNLVKRMSVLPGQRVVVMVSPGYTVTMNNHSDVGETLERALRENVVVHSLDARRLYTDASFDVSLKYPGNPQFLEYVRDSVRAEDGILASVAEWTGGMWFHNNNDLEAGFRRTAGVPEFSYSMAFTPQNLKFDGSFHNLKVVIKRPARYTVSTRRGYHAPKKQAAANEVAEQEIEETFFSREEIHGIGLGVSTQFFKPSADMAALDVVARVDARQLPFRKDMDRHVDRLIVVSGLFDPNGRYIEGIKKTIEFRLKEKTLKNQLRSGISVKSRFKVKPGGYLLRVVVRDSEGQLLSAKNSSVEIP